MKERVQCAGCQGDPDHIVEKGPEQIFMDIFKGRSAEADGRRNV